MALAFKMVRTLLHESTRRHGRVEALAMLVMWFAAGAFATSTIAATFTSYEGQIIGAAGGAVAAITAVFCKAV